MTDYVVQLIEFLKNEDNPKVRNKLMQNLWRYWKADIIDENITKAYLDILKDKNDIIDNRSLASGYLMKIYNDLVRSNTDFNNVTIDEIISIYNNILSTEYTIDEYFISQCIQAITIIGIRANRCKKSLEGLLSKKISPKVKIEALNTIERINPGKFIKFFLKQLRIRRDFKVHKHLLERIEQNFIPTRNWSLIEETIVHLLNHKERIIRQMAGTLIAKYGVVGSYEKEIQEIYYIEIHPTPKLLLIRSLGTVGTENKQTISILDKERQTGNPLNSKEAREALEKITSRSETFKHYQDLTNHFKNGKKKIQKIPRKTLQKIFLNLEYFKDPIYKKLVEELNGVYTNGYNTSVFMLTRKLTENFMIEIIKKEYLGEDDLWSYTNKNGEQCIENFSDLIRNLFKNPNIIAKAHTSAFTTTIDRIKEKLEDIREKTNPVVHSIAIIPSDKDTEELRDIVESVFPALIKMKN